MPRKVAVMIVSDQTVQNVLFIKHIGPCDFYHFISTNKMEGQNCMTDKIIKALSIQVDSTKTTIVPDDSLPEIDAILNKDFDIPDDDSIMVNMTGGTKIMSLAVYNYFARLGSASIYYIPIGKNKISKIFPFRRNGTSDITERLTLKEYLISYGVSAVHDKKSENQKLIKDPTISKKIFQSFLDIEKKREFQRIAERVRVNFRGKTIRKNTENITEAEIYTDSQKLKEYGMEFSEDDTISKKETKYITGDWFEEYLFNFIMSIQLVSEENIRQGVHIEKEENTNEYDVMFVKDNGLYVIECKTDISDYNDEQQSIISELFTSTLYKAATLKKEFGLVVKYYLFALNDFTQLKPTQKKRAENLGINLVGIDVIGDDEKLKKYLLNL
jgi:hypothetical protein